MVGKVRRPRLHGAAPRPPPRPDPAPPGAGGRGAPAAKEWDFSSSDIFSGLTIDPDSLVKKLDLDTRSTVSSKTGEEQDFDLVLASFPVLGVDGKVLLAGDLTGRRLDTASSKGLTTVTMGVLLDAQIVLRFGSPPRLEEKTLLSKKEKMKMRKERWLQKIESVRLAKQKQKAEATRKATPVVGDMQPLMEALPELSDLKTGIEGRKPSKRHVKAKAEPVDFCMMKQAQKQRLLEEEIVQFQEVIANPRYKANPLFVISEHLSKRLRQEEGKPL